MRSVISRRTLLFWLTAITAGLAGGTALEAAAGCDGNGCYAYVSFCTPTQDERQELCCKDLDGDGQYHCVTCTRVKYLCPGAIYVWGPGTGCVNPGETCSIGSL